MEEDFTYEYYEQLDESGQKTANLADISDEIIKIFDVKPIGQQNLNTQQTINVLNKKKTRRGTKGRKHRQWRHENGEKIKRNNVFGFLNKIHEHFDNEKQRKLIINIIKIFTGKEIIFQKRGSLYYALCPFHQENTPSFALHLNGSLHCYGCQISFPIIFMLIAKLWKFQKGRLGSLQDIFLDPGNLKLLK